MLLKNIRLINFKNYTDQQAYFGQKFTAVVGPNGSGKTNLLDALNYLALTRSLNGSSDLQNIRTGENFFTIIGQFEFDENLVEVRCSATFKDGSIKKELYLGGKECRRFADHIGKIPLVTLTPQDIALIWEAGEIRRKFFDQWISQTDKNYLEDLIRYQQLLKNRNALLRVSREGGAIDRELINFYTEEIIPHGMRIIDARINFVNKINPLVGSYYSQLIQPELAEIVEIQYQSKALAEDLKRVFVDALDIDLKAGRTTNGPHLDDFCFHLNSTEVRRYGSQGQQKSFLIALKLAACEVIRKMTGNSPILVLDDIFDKMDDTRIKNLLKVVAGDPFGQVIISDYSPSRSAEKLKSLVYGTLLVEKGVIKEL